MITKNFLILVLMVFISPIFAFENKIDNYRHAALWLSVGAENEVSFTLGGRGEHWGIEIGGIDDGDYSSYEVLDYPVPHDYYENLGTHKIDGTYGIDILYYFVNMKNLSAGMCIGLYSYEEAEIARSNATGWLYKQTSDTSTEMAIGLNIDYFVPNQSLLIGLTLHSVRGIAFRIGFGF